MFLLIDFKNRICLLGGGRIQTADEFIRAGIHPTLFCTDFDAYKRGVWCITSSSLQSKFIDSNETRRVSKLQPRSSFFLSINRLKKFYSQEKREFEVWNLTTLRPIGTLPYSDNSGNRISAEGLFVRVTDRHSQNILKTGECFDFGSQKCVVVRAENPTTSQNQLKLVNIFAISTFSVAVLFVTIFSFNPLIQFLSARNQGSAASSLISPFGGHEKADSKMDLAVVPNNKLREAQGTPKTADVTEPEQHVNPHKVTPVRRGRRRPSDVVGKDLDPLRCTPILSNVRSAATSINKSISRSEESWYVCR